MAVSSGEEPKQWEAAQYEAALRHLAMLQEQLDGLRATIPSLVSPLAKSGGDKALLFAQIKEAAVDSTSGLQAFRENWTSTDTQDLLKRAKESSQKDGNMDKAADVSRWGWGENEEDDEK